MRDTELDVEWRLLCRDNAFLEIPKSFHNALQGETFQPNGRSLLACLSCRRRGSIGYGRFRASPNGHLRAENGQQEPVRRHWQFSTLGTAAAELQTSWRGFEKDDRSKQKENAEWMDAARLESRGCL